MLLAEARAGLIKAEKKHGNCRQGGDSLNGDFLFRSD